MMIDSIKKLHKARKKCWPKLFKDGEEYLWIEPAFSIRKDPDDGQDYGNHGVEIHFAMRQGNRAVSTEFFTPYHTNENATISHMGIEVEFPRGKPTCTGLYFHRHTKDGASAYAFENDACLFFNRGKCWGEAGSALYGDTISKMLINGGSAAVFDELRRALAEDFEEAEDASA